MATGLSKSQYVKGRRCVKRLWLYRHRRELAAPPSIFHDGILEQGKEVGALARSVFPGGELIGEDHTQPDKALEHTEKAIAKGATVLYEAAFQFGDLLIRADLMKKRPDGAWDLFEVKSSTNRDKIKREYLFDLAVQKFVLQKQTAVTLGEMFLVRLNRDYVREKEIELDNLFVEDPMDEMIAAELEAVPSYLSSLRAALDKSEPPEALIGSVCKSQGDCEYRKTCWDHLPLDSIQYLCFIRDDQRRMLEGRGLRTIQEIPAEILGDRRQKRHVESLQKSEATRDMKSVERHLGTLQYPLYFLDFETYGYAIPRYEGTRPYQRLPFQFSLHVQKAPGAEYEHHEFLCEGAEDPRPELAKKLVELIGETGSVIAYHASFEGGVLEELAADFPAYAPALLSIASRLWDLEIPFAQRWICLSSFAGKSSIKNILPAVVPGFGYSDLQIKAGDAAMRAYYDFIDPSRSPAEKAQIKTNLLKYCERDSIAMVRILEWLRAL